MLNLKLKMKLLAEIDSDKIWLQLQAAAIKLIAAMHDAGS
jgi:hypothetical protein